jgi:hypothetical protein
MSSKITYVTGLPVVITVEADGRLTVEVDLSEAVEAVTDYSSTLFYDDKEVEEYDEAAVARIEAAMPEHRSITITV